jgi:hypothetical protein
VAARKHWLVSHHGPNQFGEFFVQRHRESLKETTYFAYLEKNDSSGSAAAAAAATESAGQPPPFTPRSSAEGRDVLLWARRWRKARVVQYVVSTALEDLSVERQKRSAGYLGKLKVNNTPEKLTLINKVLEQAATHCFLIIARPLLCF